MQRWAENESRNLLRILDQANHKNQYIMNVKAVASLKKIRPIVRCLQAAVQEKEIQDAIKLHVDLYLMQELGISLPCLEGLKDSK